MIYLSFVLGMIAILVLEGVGGLVAVRYAKKNREAIMKRAAKAMFSAPSNLHK